MGLTNERPWTGHVIWGPMRSFGGKGLIDRSVTNLFVEQPRLHRFCYIFHRFCNEETQNNTNTFVKDLFSVVNVNNFHLGNVQRNHMKWNMQRHHVKCIVTTLTLADLSFPTSHLITKGSVWWPWSLSQIILGGCRKWGILSFPLLGPYWANDKVKRISFLYPRITTVTPVPFYHPQKMNTNHWTYNTNLIILGFVKDFWT